MEQEVAKERDGVMDGRWRGGREREILVVSVRAVKTEMAGGGLGRGEEG